jgi:hypothetical protein
MNDRRILPAALLALLTLVLWLSGAAASERAAARAGYIPARFTDEGVSPAELVRYESFLKEDGAADIPAATLSRELPEGDVSTGDKNGGGLRSRVTQVFGRAGDAGFVLTGGWFPSRGDTQSCIISERTAYELWNSADAEGKGVYLDGRGYSVAGVFEGSDSHIVIQTDGLNAEEFGNMSLRFPEGGGAPEAEAYIRKAGFPDADILDLPALGYLLRLLSYLPVLFAAAAVMTKLIRDAGRIARGGALHIIAALALFAACLWIIAGTEPPPARLVPGAWSDFGFYGELAAEWAHNAGIWLSRPSEADRSLFFGALSVVLLVLLTAAAMARLIIKTRIRSFGALAVCCAVTASAAFLWTFLTGTAVSRGTWLAFAVLIFADYAGTAFGGMEHDF